MMPVGSNNQIIPLKNPSPGKAVSYAQNCLNAQFHPQKSILTTKPASAIWTAIGFV
jgi:hypothetical protein